MPLSIRRSSHRGFFRTASSVGVSGDIAFAALAAMLMPRSWSATAFRGLSGAEGGGGLPRGGGVAGRRAVFSSGTGGGWSRLRLGDGYANWVGGISPGAAYLSHMRPALGSECGEGRHVERGNLVPMIAAQVLRECGAVIGLHAARWTGPCRRTSPREAIFTTCHWLDSTSVTSFSTAGRPYRVPDLLAGSLDRQRDRST